MTQRNFEWTGPTSAGAVGIERAREHAEHDEPGWTENAATALREFAETHDDGFTVEEARAFVTAQVGAPDELRAWGAATQFALRRKWIEPTGQFRSATSSNGSPKPVYRRKES